MDKHEEGVFTEEEQELLRLLEPINEVEMPEGFLDEVLSSAGLSPFLLGRIEQNEEGMLADLSSENKYSKSEYVMPDIDDSEIFVIQIPPFNESRSLRDSIHTNRNFREVQVPASLLREYHSFDIVVFLSWYKDKMTFGEIIDRLRHYMMGDEIPTETLERLIANRMRIVVVNLDRYINSERQENNNPPNQEVKVFLESEHE